MPRLENWAMVIHGECYDDEKKRFRDGEKITTSKVVRIGDGLLADILSRVETLNTKYQLGTPKKFPKELNVE